MAQVLLCQKVPETYGVAILGSCTRERVLQLDPPEGVGARVLGVEVYIAGIIPIVVAIRIACGHEHASLLVKKPHHLASFY